MGSRSRWAAEVSGFRLHIGAIARGTTERNRKIGCRGHAATAHTPRAQAHRVHGQAGRAHPSTALPIGCIFVEQRTRWQQQPAKGCGITDRRMGAA